MQRLEKQETGTAAAFRAAIIASGKVTHEEFKILDPGYHEFFKRHMLTRVTLVSTIKLELNQIHYNNKSKTDLRLVDSRCTVLDALYLCLGYYTASGAVKEDKDKGRLVNHRYAEHTRTFGSTQT